MTWKVGQGIQFDESGQRVPVGPAHAANSETGETACGLAVEGSWCPVRIGSRRTWTSAPLASRKSRRRNKSSIGAPPPGRRSGRSRARRPQPRCPRRDALIAYPIKLYTGLRVSRRDQAPPKCPFRAACAGALAAQNDAAVAANQSTEPAICVPAVSPPDSVAVCGASSSSSGLCGPSCRARHNRSSNHPRLPAPAPEPCSPAQGMPSHPRRLQRRRPSRCRPPSRATGHYMRWRVRTRTGITRSRSSDRVSPVRPRRCRHLRRWSRVAERRACRCPSRRSIRSKRQARRNASRRRSRDP